MLLDFNASNALHPTILHPPGLVSTLIVVNTPLLVCHVTLKGLFINFSYSLASSSTLS